MSVLHAIVLGVVQGLTEFLPVSSSGHLQIVPWLADWDDFAGNEDLERSFDVAVHLGTLVGLVACLRADVWNLLRHGLRAVHITGSSRDAGGRGADRGRVTAEGRLAWLLVLSAVPAGVAGVALHSSLESLDDEVWLTAVLLAIFGLLLWAADKWPLRSVAWARSMAGRPASGSAASARSVADFGARHALLLGLAQACSLQPGVSRSGVVLSAARALAYDRATAVRLAMLMSVPVIAGAGVFVLVDIGGPAGVPGDARAAFVWGAVASAVTGYLAVSGLLALARRWDFSVFAVYRVLLSVSVLALLASPLR